MSKYFWINQATHENARASHQRLLNNHLLNEQLNQKVTKIILMKFKNLKMLIMG